MTRALTWRHEGHQDGFIVETKFACDIRNITFHNFTAHVNICLIQLVNVEEYMYPIISKTGLYNLRLWYQIYEAVNLIFYNEN